MLELLTNIVYSGAYVFVVDVLPVISLTIVVVVMAQLIIICGEKRSAVNPKNPVAE